MNRRTENWSIYLILSNIYDGAFFFFFCEIDYRLHFSYKYYHEKWVVETVFKFLAQSGLQFIRSGRTNKRQPMNLFS